MITPENSCNKKKRTLERALAAFFFSSLFLFFFSGTVIAGYCENNSSISCSNDTACQTCTAGVNDGSYCESSSSCPAYSSKTCHKNGSDSGTTCTKNSDCYTTGTCNHSPTTTCLYNSTCPDKQGNCGYSDGLFSYPLASCYNSNECVDPDGQCRISGEQGQYGTCPAGGCSSPKTCMFRTYCYGAEAGVCDGEDTSGICKRSYKTCNTADNGKCIICGDGTIEGNEECDQGGGNVANGDGCSSSCQIEAGCECSGTPSTCTCESCGTAETGPHLIIPQTNLCNPGTPSAVTEGNESYSRTCSPTVSCSAPRKRHAYCGTAININQATTPSNNLCAPGDPGTVNENDENYTRTCEGINEGNSSELCVAPRKRAGECGEDAGKKTYNPPTASLCKVGAASAVTTNNSTFTRSCGSINGYTGPVTNCESKRNRNASCVEYPATYMNQEANSTENGCRIGTYQDIGDSPTHYERKCLGVHDGVDITCQALIPVCENRTEEAGEECDDGKTCRDGTACETNAECGGVIDDSECASFCQHDPSIVGCSTNAECLINEKQCTDNQQTCSDKTQCNSYSVHTCTSGPNEGETCNPDNGNDDCGEQQQQCTGPEKLGSCNNVTRTCRNNSTCNESGTCSNNGSKSCNSDSACKWGKCSNSSTTQCDEASDCPEATGTCRYDSSRVCSDDDGCLGYTHIKCDDGHEANVPAYGMHSNTADRWCRDNNHGDGGDIYPSLSEPGRCDGITAPTCDGYNPNATCEGDSTGQCIGYKSCTYVDTRVGGTCGTTTENYECEDVLVEGTCIKNQANGIQDPEDGLNCSDNDELCTDQIIDGCHECQLVPPSCGDDEGEKSYLSPKNNLCEVGSGTNMTTGASTFNRQCTNPHGGSPISCSSLRIVNGACGTLPEAYSNKPHAGDSCRDGIYSATTDDETYRKRNCLGINDGIDTTCQARKAICGNGIAEDLEACDDGQTCFNGIQCNENSFCSSLIDNSDCQSYCENNISKTCTSRVDCEILSGRTCVGGLKNGDPCTNDISCQRKQCIGGSKDSISCSEDNECRDYVCNDPVPEKLGTCRTQEHNRGDGPSCRTHQDCLATQQTFSQCNCCQGECNGYNALGGLNLIIYPDIETEQTCYNQCQTITQKTVPYALQSYSICEGYEPAIPSVCSYQGTANCDYSGSEICLNNYIDNGECIQNSPNGILEASERESHCQDNVETNICQYNNNDSCDDDCKLVIKQCPSIPANHGDPCDDGNNKTINDTIQSDCSCNGIEYLCPHIQANEGDTCDDSNTNTINDTIQSNCQCQGEYYDCPSIPANAGDSCNDNNPNTLNDKIDLSCACLGNPYDCPSIPAQIGDLCDDNNPLTITDRYANSCLCEGILVSDGKICNQAILYDQDNSVINGGLSDDPTQPGTEDITCFDISDQECSSLSSSIGRSAIAISELGETKATISCYTYGTPVANLQIDCGNGNTSPHFNNVSQASYTCSYNATGSYNIQCLINGSTSTASPDCKKNFIIQENAPWGICGDGYINQNEDCDVPRSSNGIAGNISLSAGQLFYNNPHYLAILQNGESYADYTCIDCQLYNKEAEPCHMTKDEGCIDYQPMCKNITSTISFMKQDLGIFWWDLNAEETKRTDDCTSSGDDWKIIRGSSSCLFDIQHNGQKYGSLEEDCFINRWGDHQLFNSLEEQREGALFAGSGRYYLNTGQMEDFFINSDAPLGEYEWLLAGLSLEYCLPDEDGDEIPEKTTSNHGLFCKENVALVGPYAIQRGVFSAFQNSEIYNYEALNGEKILDFYEEEINYKPILHVPKNDGGNAVNTLIKEIAKKYTEIATSEGDFGSSTISLAKVPNKDIYIVNGNYNLTQEMIPSTNFTLIVNSGHLTIEGDFETQNAMLLVPHGNIEFTLNDVCNQTYNWNGIFITSSGFTISSSDVLNDDLNDNYCQYANVVAKGVFVGSNIELLTSKLRSNWENRFRGNKQETLYQGAALLLESDADLWINPPIGFEEIYRELGMERG